MYLCPFSIAFYLLLMLHSRLSCLEWRRTAVRNNSEFTQQDGRKKRTANRLCDERDKAITCVFCRDLD